MSINGIHGATPLLAAQSTTADSTPVGSAATRARTTEGAQTSATESAISLENKPAPLRFPWLSRLSTQLAAASKTPTPFSAPVIGDNLDKQA